MSIFHKNKNIKIDIKLLELAKNGDPKYQLKVSDEYYCHGKYDQAFIWCKKSADQKYAESYFKLSCFYLHGKGVEQNIEESIKYLELAVENGDKCAEFNLASYYLTGHYYEQNKEKGLKLLQRSAEHGNINAELTLKHYKMDLNSTKKFNEKIEEYDKAREEVINRMNERIEKAKEKCMSK